MDVGSNNSYPANALSNFSGHRFEIDGIQCNSMEGFLQSLKFKDIPMQEHVCTLVGVKAKFKGKKKPWYRTQKLYWRDIEYDRHSDEYQLLIDRAYECMMMQSYSFRRALRASGNSNFTHSMGKNDPKKTILTETEFCRRLNKMRNMLLDLDKSDYFNELNIK